MTIGILINILFFFGMGIAAFLNPRWVVYFVQLIPDTANARNEIRAVYGGFGIAIAGLLTFATYTPLIKTGVLLTVAIVLLGMASGRIVSLLIEKPGFWPLLFIPMESGLAALLLFGNGITFTGN